MAEVKWVRGRALRTVMALHGFRVGDELKLKPVAGSKITGFQDYQYVGVIVRLDMECGSDLIVQCAHPKSNETEWMYREQIVAWRPKR